jgi:hypothetical protein
VIGVHELNSLVLHWKKMTAAGVKMTDEKYVTEFTLSEEVRPEVVQFTYLVADHCEMTWGILDLSRKVPWLDVDEETANHQGGSPEGLASQLASANEQPPAKKIRVEPPLPDFSDVVVRITRSMVNVKEADLGTLRSKKTKEWVEYAEQPKSPVNKTAILNAMKQYLKMPGKWVHYSDRAVRPKFQKIMAQESKAPGAAGFCSLVAGLTLEKLSLGKVVVSQTAPGAGNPIVYFVKRTLPENLASQTAGDSVFLQHAVGQLGIDEHSTPSLSAYLASTVEKDASKPKDAPVLNWDVVKVSEGNKNLCELGLSACPAVLDEELALQSDAPHQSRLALPRSSVGERTSTPEMGNTPGCSDGGSEALSILDNEDSGYATISMLLFHDMPSHPQASASVQQLRDLHVAAVLKHIGLGADFLETGDLTGLTDDARRDAESFLKDHVEQVPEADVLWNDGDLAKALQAVCQRLS